MTKVLAASRVLLATTRFVRAGRENWRRLSPDRVADNLALFRERLALGDHDTRRSVTAGTPVARGAALASPRNSSLTHTATLLNTAPHTAQLRAIAHVMAPCAPAMDRARPPAQRPAPPAEGGAIVQRYVTLGREPTGKLDLFAKESKKKLMTPEEVPEAVDIAIQQVAEHEEHASGDDLSPGSVSKIKNLAAHMRANRGLIEAKLLQWVEAPGEAQATLVGSSVDAQWRQYDTFYELGLALGHETLPDTVANTGREERLAETVNHSEWIEHKLAELIASAAKHVDGDVSWGRYIVEKVEAITTGSYNLSDFKGKPGRLLKKTLNMQQINDKITDHITTLHDMMERWSSSQAGSLAAKMHETVGIAPLLGNPRDEAMSATMFDGQSLSSSEDIGPPKLKRGTRINTADDEAEAENLIIGKRVQSIASKNAGDRRLVEQGMMSLERAQKNAAKRTGLLKTEYPGFSDHRDDDLATGDQHISTSSSASLTMRNRVMKSPPQSTSAPPPKINTNSPIPERNVVAQYFVQQRKENEETKRKQAKEGKINKTSKAKGRKNVGTRDEMDPDTLLSRLFSAPLWAGRSMTTARMMQLVEMLGGDETHKTAVAYALFAYWRRTYNKGLTPIHTFHETMDVAHNFGVPYEAFHYPVPSHETGDIDYMAPHSVPMTGTPGLKEVVPETIDHVERTPPPSGLRRVNRARDDAAVILQPPTRRAPAGKAKWD